MAFSTITPGHAKSLIDQGAVLFDIREESERARERIGGSRHLPLSNLESASAPPSAPAVMIFHCKSGGRTAAHMPRLQAYAGLSCDTYMLNGGLDGWRKAGLPVVIDRSQPIELQRQVQIVAGGLGLAGTILGSTVSPLFYIVPAFVGAGLLFAGISGFCGMAKLLMRAPWNRVTENASET